MVEASVTGLVRTLLIIIGVFVLLRFLGQLMTAKRNMEEERKLNEQQRKFNQEKERKRKNLGKTSILKRSQGSDNIQDVDYEEM
ncbi:MAG: hypothetical protein ACO2Z9_08200 [Crocinitomicaceae bacterium]